MNLAKRNKSIIVLSFIFWWLIAGISFAIAEELVGTIVSVDETSRQLVVAEKSKSQSDEKKRIITVKLPEHMIFKRPNGRLLPGWVRIGNTMNLKGHYSGDNQQQFTVTMVHHRFMRHRHDPTGVRGRIGRGCGRMFREHHVPDSGHTVSGNDKKNKDLDSGVKGQAMGNGSVEK